MSKDAPDAAPVVVWYGSDPVQFSAVLAALRENQIQAFDVTTHSHLLEGGLLSRSHPYAIFVPADDEDCARKIVSRFPQLPPRGLF